MKKVILFLFIVCVSLDIMAQQVSIKDVSTAASTDITARREARKDSNGKNCALIRVGIVGVKDMTFPDAVGSVAHVGSEYQVYVQEGLQSLRYRGQGGAITGEVRFADYPKVSSILSNMVYRVVFETENHLRAAIFSVEPLTATVTIDGKPATLDAEGMAVIEKPVGRYRYQVTAPGYEMQTGTVSLTEEEISTTTSIQLEQRMHPLSIKCVPPNASLFIDNEPYGPLNEISDLTAAEGRRTIRLLAVGYDDFEQTIDVKSGMMPLNFTMQQKKQEVRVHKEERTRTLVNVRPGYYFFGGANLYNKKKYDAQIWGLDLSFSAMQHFGGIFAFREGIGYGWSPLSDKEMDNFFKSTPKDTTTQYIEIPLQIGFSFPFGKGNRHLFSIMAGGYGRYMWTPYAKKDSDGKSSKEVWDYGLRLTALLEINRFVFGAEASSSLDGRGMFYGVKVGVNMGKKQ